jgi:hypothetical protein
LVQPLDNEGVAFTQVEQRELLANLLSTDASATAQVPMK